MTLKKKSQVQWAPNYSLHSTEKQQTQKEPAGTSLAVQWLGLWTSTTGGVGSIPGQGTKIPCAMWQGKITKQNKTKKSQWPQSRHKSTSQTGDSALTMSPAFRGQSPLQGGTELWGTLQKLWGPPQTRGLSCSEGL